MLSQACDYPLAVGAEWAEGLARASVRLSLALRGVHRWIDLAHQKAQKVLEAAESVLQGATRRALLLEIDSDTEAGELSNSDTDKLRRTAKHARQVVTQAIKRLEQLVPEAKNPQQLAVSAGILCDKAAQLEQVVQTLEERELRLSAALGQQVAALVSLSYEALGLELTPPIRHALSDLLLRSGLLLSQSHRLGF